MEQFYSSKALVAEDDFIQRQGIVAVLEDIGLIVTQTDNAEVAETALGQFDDSFLIMFTDMSLSGSKTGAQLAYTARHIFPHLRVVVMSGGRKPDLPAGSVFIPKPWTTAELLQQVTEACVIKYFMGAVPWPAKGRLPCGDKDQALRRRALTHIRRELY